MLYELRHYTTPDTSSLGALSGWFGEHVVPEWQARGMRVVGCWTVAIGEQPRFTTMLAYDDAIQRQQQFGDFRRSDAWRQMEDRLYTGPGRNGLITGINTALLNPTPYSPDPFQFTNAASPGVFEERIYRARNGHTFAGVNRRFSDHTTRIFARHGIVPVGFWSVEIGADQPSLYYLVRFDDLSEYNPRWNRFRSDPEWQQVRAASEQDGNLLLWIRSTILAPTPFSPMQ
jgi:hypothetical protein